MPKMLTLALLSLMLWIGHVAAKSIERGKRVEQEVTQLQAEAQKMEKENRMLKERIDYFKTDFFQEEEAKKKLNYQNPQEKVVVIKPSIAKEEEPEENTTLPVAPTRDTRPNYEKWWSQFFGQ